LQNSTGREPGFLAWAAFEAERSPRFRRGIDRLRRLAAGDGRAGYPRSTGRLTRSSFAELERALTHSARLPDQQRPRAWRNNALAAADGLRHVRNYLRGCRKLARGFLGSEQAAPLIHELVCRHGYRIQPPPEDLAAAPTAAVASSLAAHITGASWGAGATALRQTWYRHRPQPARPRWVATTPRPPFAFQHRLLDEPENKQR
jgi:hypothetical protein